MTALPPFQRLLDEHGRAVHRFLAAYAGPQDADDLWQETMLAALRTYPDLRDDSNLRGWLFAIARRKAVDGWRRGASRPRPVADVPDVAAPPPRDDGVEVWDLVRELPDGQREALALRFGGDLPYREVAAMLDCTEEAARQRVRAGLSTLRRRSRTETT